MTSDELELCEAIKEEKYEVVQSLVRTCPDVNFTSKFGWTPLFGAARSGHVRHVDSRRPWSKCKTHRKMVELFLEAGANPNLPNNVGAETPLMMASSVNCTEVMEALIKAGANPNLPDHKGETSLHVASQHGFEDGTKLLLDAGADPNLTNNLGQSSLFLAVKNGRSEVVKDLFDAGADPTLADENGDTPLSAMRVGGFHINFNPPSISNVSAKALLISYPQLTTLRTLCARVIRKHRVDHQFVPQIVFRQPNEIEEEREYRKRKRAFKERRSNKKR